MQKIFSLLVLFAILLSSCKTEKKETQSQFFQGKDSYGREVKLNSEPLRVISYSPGITEMVYLLEAEEKLVGITNYCNYPEATKKVEKIGELQPINFEKVLTLQPDLVLIGSIVSKDDVNKMESIGINVFTIKEENSIDGLFSTILQLGELLNRKKIAQQKAEEFRQLLDSIPARGNEKSIYYVVGYGSEGDYTAPKNSMIHEIIEYSGGRNIGEDLQSWKVSREYLFEQDPDLIFIRSKDYSHFIKTSPYNELRAVKENNVFPIESGWMDIISPRNFQAINFIANTIQKSSEQQK